MPTRRQSVAAPQRRDGPLSPAATATATATATADAGWQGLGPRSRQWLATVGVTEAFQLRSRDPFVLYAQLRAVQPQVSRNLLYALIGAIDGRDWRVVARDDRTSILLRLEAMKLL
jgi:DNA transformation protein and related proteins